MGRRVRVCGIVLAAGAGSRFGGPKALARDGTGTPWVELAVAALRDGGCERVVVVLGAQAERARGLVPEGAEVALAVDWAGGLSRSLAAGLDAARGADAAVIVPVDTPELPAAAVTRLVAHLGSEPRSAMARATYDGVPGHPVVLGAVWWADASALTGDVGAGPLLARLGAQSVECGDLWSGRDRDTPGQ